MRPRQRAGFSIIEALVTALLVGMALAMVGLIARDFNRVMARSHTNDTALEALLALRKTASELAQATGVVGPALNGTSAVLTFRRIDPNFPGRIPATLLPDPSPLPAAWEPRDPAYLVHVRYSLNGSQQLVRRVTFAGGIFEQQVCAEGVLNFQASHPRRGHLQLSITVAQAQQPRALSLPVNLQAVTAELVPL
jgi:type II secretory pathway pseudopilin PulG